MPATTSVSRDVLESFLIHEAELLDTCRFEEWQELFSEDALYVIPLDPDSDIRRTWALLYDTPLRRKERVYRLTHLPFPSQSPRSRTLHYITNLRMRSTDGPLVVASNQLVYEMRLGDFRQVGLGEQRTWAAEVEHELAPSGETFRITRKTISLINRGAPISNLTFLL